MRPCHIAEAFPLAWAVAMNGLGRRALLFAVIGTLLYAGAYGVSEWLLYRTGHSNPFFKLNAAKTHEFDWVILGASHAMPFDFADFQATIERQTELRVINLASPGTGPLYNRFVLEQFLQENRARSLLYVVDSFGFYSVQWNEDRFSDAKLLRRTPFQGAVARRLFAYAINEGIDPRALLDYVTGFSKINNRERFQRDVWEGEAQFERTYRPSPAASRKRVEYLFPSKTPDPAVLARYVQEFNELVELAQVHGIQVVVIKTPIPTLFRDLLPDEPTFDRVLSRELAGRGVPLHDFSGLPTKPEEFFDTDHLNRKGLSRFFAEQLAPILMAQRDISKPAR